MPMCLLTCSIRLLQAFQTPANSHSHHQGPQQSDQPAFSTTPSVIHDAPGLRVWYRGLGAIRLPKAAAYFSIAGLHLESSPLHAAALHLLLKLVRESLNELAYLADLAGLQYEVSNHSKGCSDEANFGAKVQCLALAGMS